MSNTTQTTNNKGYKIIFEMEKALEILHSILCNGALDEFSGYGFSLDYSKDQYNMAKDHLKANNKNVCFEDILVQMVRVGGKLRFIDVEGEGTYTKGLNIGVLLEGLNNASLDRVMEIINEEDDATTGELVLQEILFGEIVFG